VGVAALGGVSIRDSISNLFDTLVRWDLPADGTRIWSLMQLERQLQPEAYGRRRGGHLDRRRTRLPMANNPGIGAGAIRRQVLRRRDSFVRPNGFAGCGFRPSAWG
jgi:hypothetical protein